MHIRGKILLYAVGMLAAVALCSCGAQNAVPDVVAAAPTVIPQLSTPATSMPEATFVWAGGRAQIPADVPVYKPTWLPERFGSPKILEARVDPQYGLLYTIVYPAKDENLAFILNMGAGALGNFPPSDVHVPVTIHGMPGSLEISTETHTMGIFWQEHSQSYQIKAYSKQITREELLRIANSLVPVSR